MDAFRVVVAAHYKDAFSDSPTSAELEAWRAKTDPHAPAGSLLAALFDLGGLSAEREGVRGTIRWFARASAGVETRLFLRMDFVSAESSTSVLVFDFVHDRFLGLPAAATLRAQVEETLRAMVERCVANGRIKDEAVFAEVCQFLERDLPYRSLVVSPPPASVGRYAFDLVVATLRGKLAEVPSQGGERTIVLVREGRPPFLIARAGTWFKPLVVLRRLNAQGTLVDEREQDVSLGYLGIDLEYEPLPAAVRSDHALDVLERWKRALGKRLSESDDDEPLDFSSLMPSDLTWPQCPVGLVIQTIRHGAAGPRPTAGQLGPVAVESAARLTMLNDREIEELQIHSAMRGFRVGDYALVFQSYTNDEGDREEAVLLGPVAGPLLPILYWFPPPTSQAFSADADEPTLRLFAMWLSRALTTRELDHLLSNGHRPSKWLLFQDRLGEPIDHRVEVGMVMPVSYAVLDPLPRSALGPGCADRATSLLRRFVRDVIDPEVQFGQRCAELGLP